MNAALELNPDTGKKLFCSAFDILSVFFCRFHSSQIPAEKQRSITRPHPEPTWINKSKREKLDVIRA
ncbi:MAG: hypothetical protein GY710_24335 [Desulfobacteraceae bacterium]|nr:hypothetical protein [Desulfobacteraceae bacterium]